MTDCSWPRFAGAPGVTDDRSRAHSGHIRASGFIEHLAVLDDFPQEEIVSGEALAYLPGRTHDHINRKVGLDAVQDLNRLACALAFERHDDEKIYIRIFARVAARMRTKQDNALRPEFVGDTAAERLDS